MEGIKKAKAESPDVILLDIKMPDMDGFETCRRLKADKSTEHIPVIMITAVKTDSWSRIKGLETGADSFLAKPIDEAELVSQVKVALRIKRAEDKLREERDSLERTVKERTASLVKSETQYRTILETAIDGFWLADIKGRLLQVNDAYCRISGYSKQELLTMCIPDLEAAETSEETACHIQEVMAQGEGRFESRHRRKDGSIFDVEISVQYRANEGGQLIAFLRDITDLLRAEENYRVMFHEMLNGFALHEIICDGEDHPADYRFLAVNPAFERMTGLKAEEVVGRTVLEALPNTERYWIETYGKVALTGKPAFFENYSAELKKHFEITAFRPAPGQFACIFADITARKQAEQTLINSEKKYRDLADSLPQTIVEFDIQGNLIYVNRNGFETFGYTREEFDKGLNVFQMLMPEEHNRARENVQRVLHEESESGNEYRAVRKDGSTFPVIIYTSAITRENKQIGLRGIIVDISESKLAEQHLRESEERFKQVTENANELIWEVDMDGTYLYCSSAAERILGYPADELVKQKHFYDLFAPDVREGLKDQASAAFQRKEPFFRFVNPNIHKNGSLVILETSGTPLVDKEGNLLGYRGVDMDITQRKLAEEELKQTLDKLRKSLIGTIRVLSSTVETRDPYTAGHQRRVSSLARAIAQEMGLSNDTVDTIRMAGIIHDTGKISIPSEILSKPSMLSDLEMSLIRVHPQSGFDILKDVELPYPIAEVVLQHHERLDGSGYPNGLKGEQILLEARIIAVADVVEAISSHRPYRPAKGIDVALEEIENNKGILYDEQVAEVCLKLFMEKEFEFEQ
jgi:PAS domain S-box-containing protein